MSPLEAGERILLIDTKGRRYLITLEVGGEFHFHRGIVSHDDLIGREDGTSISSTGNEKMLALRPTMADFILKMRRGAQVVYPKDAAMILLNGDIYPGARVLEAGAGSGALTIALLRAVGPEGRVVTYEVREDFAETARANVEQFLGKADNLEIRIGSIYEHIGEEEFDRAVLDLPEPWRALPVLRKALRSGGVLACYLPTVLQVHQLHLALDADRAWASVRTTETLVRSWHVEERSVRPDHKMVGHTGFITVARRVNLN